MLEQEGSASFEFCRQKIVVQDSSNLGVSKKPSDHAIGSSFSNQVDEGFFM